MANACGAHWKKVFKKIVKKVYIVLLFVILIANSISAQTNLNMLRGKEADFDNTYMYLDKGPELICQGDLLVLGDSFGFLFCEYIDKGVNYIVHQGYSIEKIFKEFLPFVKKDEYKYAFLMIGPNDFMSQTDIFTFKSILQFVVSDLKLKGIQVIVTDYCDPDYSVEMASILYFSPLKCWQYDFALKEVMSWNGLLYVPMSDLLAEYGRMPLDPVHPDKRLYGPLLERVEKLIEEDKLAKSSILP